MSHKTFSFPMSKKTANHMLAPQSASFVAQMRNVFGNENVDVLYVKENDLVLGEPQPMGAPCIHGGNGLPLIQKITTSFGSALGPAGVQGLQANMQLQKTMQEFAKNSAATNGKRKRAA